MSEAIQKAFSGNIFPGVPAVPPVPLSPTGQPYDAIVHQLATSAQREGEVVFQDGVDTVGTERLFPAYGPNLSILTADCDPSLAFEIAFNEPKNWQSVRPGQVWLGQIFSRVFFRLIRLSGAEPAVGTVSFSYGSALRFPFPDVFREAGKIVRVTSGHVGNGSICSFGNPKKVRVDIFCKPYGNSSTGNVDAVGFGNSESEAERMALAAQELGTYWFTAFDNQINGGVPMSEVLPQGVCFWPAMDGLNPAAGGKCFRTSTSLETSGDVYLYGVDGAGVPADFFSNTPGFVWVVETFQV